MVAESNCTLNCMCPPSSSIVEWFGYLPEVTAYCIPIETPWKELPPPYRGCYYGMIARPDGVLSTTNHPAGRPDVWYCDYGDPYRTTQYVEYFELIFDGCEGACPEISIKITGSISEQYALASQIRDFLLANFPESEVPSLSSMRSYVIGAMTFEAVDLMYPAFTRETPLHFSCPNKLYCREDLFIPVIHGTTLSPMTTVPGDCCCGANPTTPIPEYDYRYYPPEHSARYKRVFGFSGTKFPVGWVVIGDYYVDAEGLHCPSGCFVYPCVFFESQLEDLI